ncbi:MAG: hypothetical protein BEN18_02980 [Epulopiscium sp. Nuni2H_MBin001]|nr:MAG: hypothetical protein BEN18_02980 [Epulopiscium sp. Nuni2H_MBin001]
MNTKKFLVALIGGVSLLGANAVCAQAQHDVIVKESAETIEYNYGDDTIIALVKATYPEFEDIDLIVSSIQSQGPITKVELLAMTGSELYELEIATITVRFIHIHDDHWEFEIIKINNEDITIEFDLSTADVIDTIKTAYPSLSDLELIVSNISQNKSLAEVELVTSENIEPINIVFIHNQKEWICLGKKSFQGANLEFDLPDEDVMATIRKAYPEFCDLDICFSSVITDGTLTEIELLIFPDEYELDAPIETMTIVFVYDNDMWLFLGQKPTVHDTILFDLSDNEIISLVNKAYPDFARLDLFVSSVTNQGDMAWVDLVVAFDNETEIISILFTYLNDKWVLVE